MIELVGGQLAGFGLGTDLDVVVSALTDRCGPPTDDPGWNAGCPLDFGDEITDELQLRWGPETIVRFSRLPDQQELDAFYDGGPAPTTYGSATLTGWSHRPALGVEPLVEVAVPDGVVFGATLDETAASLGASPNYDEYLAEVFGLALLVVGEVDYVGDVAVGGLPGNAPLTQVYVGGVPLCD